MVTEVAASLEWNGIPDNPTVPGWHLLKRRPTKWIPPMDIGREEVFRWDTSKKLPWCRFEKATNYGWEPGHMAGDWEYLGRLELSSTLSPDKNARPNVWLQCGDGETVEVAGDNAYKLADVVRAVVNGEANIVPAGLIMPEHWMWNNT